MQMGTKLIAIAALLMLSSTVVQAQEYVEGGYVSGHPQPLFSNQYTQGMANQATAQMYVAPVPVPPWVGHTYYTYQPLYPHELMHQHSQRYHSYYDNGDGLNRTSVRYYSPPVRTMMQNLWGGISLPRP